MPATILILISIYSRLLFDILKLSLMPATILMLLTSKIGFAATDAVTGLKLVEKGVPKVIFIYLIFLMKMN